MEIRPLSDREDIRDVIEAHGRAWKEAYDHILPSVVLWGIPTEGTDRQVRKWEKRLPDPPNYMLCAVVDGRARGHAHVRWTDTDDFVGPRDAELTELYVHPDYWGEGIGTALLEAGIDRLPDATEGIVLEVFADNERGRGFYEAQGFEQTGTGTYRVAIMGYDTAIYRREL